MTDSLAKLSPAQMLKKGMKHEEEERNQDQNPEQLCVVLSKTAVRMMIKFHRECFAS